MGQQSRRFLVWAFSGDFHGGNGNLFFGMLKISLLMETVSRQLGVCGQEEFHQLCYEISTIHTDHYLRRFFMLLGSQYISFAESISSALSQRYLCLIRFQCEVPRKSTYKFNS